jgi:ATP-binding cassette, subfamily C (CFTR/MRP), member 1
VEEDEPLWKGYMYAVLLFLNASLTTIILSQYFHRMFIVGLRVRTALIAMIYRKVGSITLLYEANDPYRL